MNKLFLSICAITLLGACSKKNGFDASGNFEADEVIVSAGQSGQLLWFQVEEGRQYAAGEKVGQIDVSTIRLQQEQVEASIEALGQKTSSPADQVELVRRQLLLQEAQLDHLLHEQRRTENLVKADAATRKQLDDINAQVDQQRKQIEVTREQMRLSTTTVSTQNRSILSEAGPLRKTRDRYGEEIKKGDVINPINGVVLTKYALAGEMQTTGKPLYKIASLDTLTLRAYITGAQLSQLKIGLPLRVRIDQGEKGYKYYDGRISWISDKSEFTPKTIQTKDERANLVYAVKVLVRNDGFLKIGMYGELIWNKQ